VVLKTYDLLEWQGKDIRLQPFVERRVLLEKMYHTIISSKQSDEKSSEQAAPKLDFPHSFEMTKIPLLLSERMQFDSWEAVARPWPKK